MSTLAFKGPARGVVGAVHRWSGLAMLVMLLVAGLTGTLIAFRYELDGLINRDWYTVPAQQQRLPIQTVINAVEDHFPGTYVTSVRLGDSASDALRVYLGNAMDAGVAHVHTPGMKTTLEYNEIFVDPYTAGVLGYRNTGHFDLGGRGFIPTMVRLHYTLYAGAVGVYLMGIVSLLWFVTSLIGLLLSWPKPFFSRAAWAKVLGVRWHSGTFKINYDLHRSTGLLFLPVLATVAFTGIYLNLPKLVKPAVTAFSTLNETPKLTPVSLGVPAFTPDQAIAKAFLEVPGAKPYSVSRSFVNGTYSVRMRLPSDVSASGNNVVYFSMADGAIARTVLARQVSAGQTFINWQYPLHSGLAFGLTGQILVMLGGLVLILACVTGLWMWLRRKRPARERKHKTATAEPSADGWTTAATSSVAQREAH